MEYASLPREAGHAAFAADLFRDDHAEGWQFRQMFERAPQKTFTLAEVEVGLR